MVRKKIVNIWRKKKVLYFLVVLLIGFCMRNMAQVEQINNKQISLDLNDYYWDALLHLAKANKEKALEVIEAVQNNGILPSLAWKQDNPTNIEDYFDSLFIACICDDPQELTSLGLFDSVGIHKHNAFLTDVSPEVIRKRYQRKKTCLEKIKKYSDVSLSAEQKVSYDLFCYMLDNTIKGEKFLLHEYKINQMCGIFSDLCTLLTQLHPLNTSENVAMYLQRLNEVPKQLAQTKGLLEYQKSRGIMLPRFALEKVINSIDRLLSNSASDSIFFLYFEKETAKNNLQEISTFNQVQEIIQNKVHPAFEQLKTYCTELLDTIQTNHGVWLLPDGNEYYNYLLKRKTTTDVSADEIHQIGLEQVTKINEEIKKILKKLGVKITKETSAHLQDILSSDEFYYPNTDEGRKECLANFETIVNRCRKELYPLFDLKPNNPVMIKQVPVHKQEGAPLAYYYEPSLSGDRPGTFYINLRNMHELSKCDMEVLAVHEAEPGHHFQIALQINMPLPILRKFTFHRAFVEGWGLYCEKLAYEHGFYSSPYAELAYLKWELLRSARLVVDTGIHYKRWSREQAIDYLHKTTGIAKEQVITEVERYFVLPAQACSYKIGQLCIMKLKKRAQEVLGPKFDIKKFHSVILKTGSVPLPILEEVIERYIQDES